MRNFQSVNHTGSLEKEVQNALRPTGPSTRLTNKETDAGLAPNLSVVMGYNSKISNDRPGQMAGGWSTQRQRIVPSGGASTS